MITSWPRETRSVPSVSGREHRVTAGVVGDREHIDALVGGQLAGELHHLAARARRDQAAARDDLGGDDECAGACELFAKRSHRGVADCLCQSA